MGRVVFPVCHALCLTKPALGLVRHDTGRNATVQEFLLDRLQHVGGNRVVANAAAHVIPQCVNQDVERVFTIPFLERVQYYANFICASRVIQDGLTVIYCMPEFVVAIE